MFRTTYACERCHRGWERDGDADPTERCPGCGAVASTRGSYAVARLPDSPDAA